MAKSATPKSAKKRVKVQTMPMAEKKLTKKEAKKVKGGFGGQDLGGSKVKKAFTGENIGE